MTLIKLDAEQIQALIPHRPPFLLVDRIVELEPGKRIVGLKEVSLERDGYLQGHFPGYPVMPGVLIVEALAQTGAVLLMHDEANSDAESESESESESEKMPLFARIDNCRFRLQVRPGDTLRLEVEVTSFRPPVGKAHGRALVADKLACEADITFAFGSVTTAR
jgi:3-hydroxyacyl-[acyl-carrier-protein] dehydratase